MSWRHRLAVTKENEAVFAGLLAGLGVTESAVIESPPSQEREILAVELSRPERWCWDDLAARTGVSTRSGGRLARAVLRSFLIHPWNLPLDVDRAPLEDTAAWPGDRASARQVFKTLLDRLSLEDTLAALKSQLGRLTREQLLDLQRAVAAELERIDSA